MSTNYIYVDEEPGVVHVYDSLGDADPKDFDCDGILSRRSQAEAYAKKLAAEIGCDWGTNYS